MIDLVHKLIFKANGANTACKLNVVAIYPINWYAMTDEAGKANIRVTIGKGTTCTECKKRMKEDE